MISRLRRAASDEKLTTTLKPIQITTFIPAKDFDLSKRFY